MGIKWEIDFDYQRFEEVLFEASLKAFTDIQNDFAHETFYAFALASSASFARVDIVANTEEGLNRKASKFQSRPEYKIQPLSNIKNYLRAQITEYDFWGHSMPDYVSYFQISNDMIIQHSNLVESVEENNEIYLHEEGFVTISVHFIVKLERICLRVLSQLDEIKIFEQTNSRDNITLEVNIGYDEPDIQTKTIAMLNPPSVYKKYLGQVEQYLRLQKEI